MPQNIRGAYDKTGAGGQEMWGWYEESLQANPVPLSPVTPVFTQRECAASKLPW